MKKTKLLTLIVTFFASIQIVSAAVCTPAFKLTNQGYGKLATYNHQYDIGTEYICNPGDGKLRTFYVVSSTPTSVEMIADRNLGDNRVAFITKSDFNKVGGSDYNWQIKPIAYGGQTAYKYLIEKTKNWKYVTVSMPSLKTISKINGNVVAKIVNGNYKLTNNEMLLNNIFYSNLATMNMNNASVSNNCITNSFCATVSGYWLSDSWMFNENNKVTSKAYQILKMSYKNKTTGGRINVTANLGINGKVGVRPVITVNKKYIAKIR
ncbi:MAG: hypothetical protein E7158_05895 [Firmicutes bacterium]|nr:hypothetical protein [Bacillota bacterium]